MPFWSKLIIKIFLSGTDAEFLCGDIEEVYKEYKTRKGKLLGGLWLVFHLIRTLPPIILSNISWSLSMIKNYIKIALRNIIKNKVYSFVNISGLAIGLVSCLIIFLAIANELSFDKFYNNYENIYRVVTLSKQNGETEYDGYSPYPMASAIRNDYPDLTKTAQVLFSPEVQVNVGVKQFRIENTIYADSQYYDIFQHQFVAGTKETAKDAPDGIVLTETIAKILFGNNPAVGETIKVDNSIELKVVGVIKDVSPNTHMPINMIISSSAANEDLMGFSINDWHVSVSASQTYILKPESISTETMEDYLKTIGDKYLPDRRKETESFHIQRLDNIHISSMYESFNYRTSPETITIFGAIGLLILMIASINFINLSTAQSMKRSKEVGVRKVLGAKKMQVAGQLMGETITYTTLAIVIALIATYLLLPQVNAFLDTKLEFSIFNNLALLPFIFVLFSFVCILAGIYPSIILSRFSPVEAFRSKVFKSTNKAFSLRNGLVVFQFVISQVLIIGTIVISMQMDYFKNKNMGFNKEQILNIDIPAPNDQKAELFRTKLLQNPQIVNVTFASGAPITDRNMGSYVAPDPNKPDYRIHASIKPADEHYLDVFKIHLVAGEFYSKYIPGDTLYKYVINEKLAHELAQGNPSGALGKTIEFARWPGRVIGVVEDFHQASLREEIIPLMMVNFLSAYHYEASVRLSKNVSEETLNYIQKSWEDTYPEYTYSSGFFDEYIHELYEREEDFLSMINLFAILAIFIACLGLLGLVSFIAVQKTKEIGLRKVMGATTSNILFLLSKEFTRWVLIANFIAWPVAYYAMNKWLQDYAYRIDIEFWVFLAGGLISVFIAWLTMSIQSYRASIANPVDSIRTE